MSSGIERVCLCLVIIVAAIVIGPGQDANAHPPIALVINDQTVATDVPPVLESGRTLVPVRVVSENLGTSVGWDPGHQRVSIKGPGTDIVLTIGEPRAMVNGVSITLDAPPRILNGRTMVPLRFVAESLGADVDWNHASRTVTVKSYRITDVRWERTAGRGTLAIKVPASASWAVTAVDGGDSGFPRIVLDVQGAVLSLPDPVIMVGDGPVMRVRTGMVSAGVSRLVVDLTEPVRYRVTRAEDGQHLWLEIGYKVTRASLERRPEGQAVIINTTGPVNWESSLLTGPDRLVIDVKDATLSRDAVPNLDLNHPLIRRVRIAQNSIDPDVVRVVLDLKRSVRYHVLPVDKGLEVFLYSEVSDVSVSEAPGEVHVNIRTTLPGGHAVKLLTDPARLQVDVPFTTMGRGVLSTLPGRGPVSGVDIAEVSDEDGVDCVRVTVSIDPYQGHRIQVEENLIRIVLVSSATHGRTIVIDPGHGGRDPGAIGPSGTHEKDVVLAMSLMLRDRLEAKGANVVMTRDRDTTVELFSRPEVANLVNADLFISVHANGFTDPTKRGFEAYYWSNHPDSRVLGEIVWRHMQVLGLPDRGLKTARFVVIRECRVPAVLVEIGFVTNPVEEKLLLDRAFQARAADAMAAAITEFLDR